MKRLLRKGIERKPSKWDRRLTPWLGTIVYAFVLAILVRNGLPEWAIWIAMALIVPMLAFTGYFPDPDHIRSKWAVRFTYVIVPIVWADFIYVLIFGHHTVFRVLSALGLAFWIAIGIALLVRRFRHDT